LFVTENDAWKKYDYREEEEVVVDGRNETIK